MRTCERKRPRRRRRCSRRRRVGWFRGFRDVLVCVCVSNKRRHRGSDLAGYRVVRVLRVKVDRKRRQVVELVARLYGGRADVNLGFNGPLVRLDDRREFFRDGQHLGVCEGSQTIPVDAYYARMLTRRNTLRP
jgi:hypothetical protein